MGGIDAKEIKVLSTNLEKAVKEKLPAAHITDILNRLKNEVVATEQVLRVCHEGFTGSSCGCPHTC